MLRSASGLIETIVGTGTPGFSGDGGTPVSARINTPGGLFAHSSGSLFFSDRENHRIREVRGVAGGPPLSMQPNSGTVNGRDTVQILGSGFFDNSTIRVLFGDTPAANVQIVDETTLAVTVPPGSLPSQNVSVFVTVNGVTEFVAGGYT